MLEIKRNILGAFIYIYSLSKIIVQQNYYICKEGLGTFYSQIKKGILIFFFLGFSDPE